MVGGMLGANDHAIHVEPNEGGLELQKARRLVRGGSHRIRRSARADPRRSKPCRAGGPRNHRGPLDQGRLLLVSFIERRGVIRLISAKTMRKRRGPGNRHVAGELVSEYRFDYAKSRPNRYARRIAKNAVVVVLDPKRVNSLLRATIAAPKKPGSRRAG